METNKQLDTCCPCGLTKDVCELRHVTLDKELQGIRNSQESSETRMREYMDTAEAHMIERLEFQKEIASEITTNIKLSYKESIQRLIDGLNLHRSDINTLKDELPTNAIGRMVAIEDCKPKELSNKVNTLSIWRWLLVGAGSVQGLLIIMMWKYFDLLAQDYQSVIKQAELLLKKLGG